MTSYKKITSKKGSKKTSWQISYKSHDGRWLKKIGFDTKYDAQKWYQDVYLNQEKNKENEPQYLMTFLEAAEQFLDNHAKIHCKTSTKTFYEGYLRRHIVPEFGSKWIEEINHSDINRLISKKLDAGYSHKTINHILTTTELVYNYLIRCKITTENPMCNIKRLKLKYTEMNFLNKEEVHALLKICKYEKPDLYPIVLTAILTGARQGEILALTWDDILFSKRKISINKSRHRGEVTTPKTDKSIRFVDLPQALSQTLKEHKLTCIKTPNKLVFPNHKGNYICPDNMRARHFNPLVQKLELPNIRFHDLRHTFAALLIAENIPIKYIQNQLGHSSIDVTLDTYGHLLPDVHENAIKILDNIMNFQLPEYRIKTVIN